ncbi:hypothetical protein cyc_03744 [Cyclospora cayetanensis]|uniref:Uncharacterized protein n=1 Tax=Cyclospora cayetanensis TaxID=88456 RepID=A0A1D3D8S4_9EIME|nr:hypothetical protein cyc_03744 [Cyclospora cayetanensis]
MTLPGSHRIRPLRRDLRSGWSNIRFTQFPTPPDLITFEPLHQAMPKAQHWNATTNELCLSQITNILLQKNSISTQESQTLVSA